MSSHKRAEENQTLTFGQEIVYHRKAKNLSQADAARLMHLSVGYLCDIEKGRSMPSREMILEIAEYLDIHKDYLLFMAGYAPLDLRPLWLDTHGRSIIRTALDGARAMLSSEERNIQCN